ncbi:MAG: hypothetical protein AB7T06_07570 [Kofleriaceae bacterium]
MDLEQRILEALDEHELGRGKTRDLPADLTADRSTGSRDKHAAASNRRLDLHLVELDRIAPEEILYADVADT